MKIGGVLDREPVVRPFANFSSDLGEESRCDETYCSQSSTPDDQA